MEIKADILDIAREPVNKTKIVYGANLNFGLVKPYLIELAEEGRLNKIGKKYVTTIKGLEYISHIEAIRA